MSGGGLVRPQLRSHEEGLLDICGTSVLIRGHLGVEVKGNDQPAPAHQLLCWSNQLRRA